MAIKGLTDREISFPQIGDIRKGMMKDGVSKSTGRAYSAPVDLDYFRVEFDERETEAQEMFAESYKDKLPQVREINIVLPFNDIERVWDPFCEAYTAGRMVARSDGATFIYLVDLKTGKPVVINGLDEDGKPVPHKDVVGMAGKTVIKCRPVGRLKVILPELRRAAYVVVHTTSIIDIRNISEQLAAIKQINGGRIVGIPLVLKRRPKEISVPNDDGTRRRLTKWMLSIEADPKWVSAKLEAMHMAALPSGAGKLALPAVSEVEELDQVDEEFTDEADDPLDLNYTDTVPLAPDQQSEQEEEAAEDAQWDGSDMNETPAPQDTKPAPAPAQPPASAPAANGKKTRPLSAVDLRHYVGKKANEYIVAKKETATDKQRQLLAMCLRQVFEGDDTRRKQTQLYLTGFASTKDMSGAHVKALIDWLNPTQDSGGAYVVNSDAAKEAYIVLTASAIEHGQQELF